jgi:protoporphyrinogen IX oxidase
MDPQVYLWWKAAHVFGFVVWIAGLASLLHLLYVHPWVGENNRAPIAMVERRVAILMDLGALLAIAAGLRVALGTSAFSSGGWLHVKLTIGVGLLALHGLARAKVRKFRNGDIKPISPYLFPLLLVIAAGMITFGATNLLHK